MGDNLVFVQKRSDEHARSISGYLFSLEVMATDSDADELSTCPVCEDPVEPPSDNETFPFCSSRCKQVDLGRWFDESYSIPMTPHDTERTLSADDEDDASS